MPGNISKGIIPPEMVEFRYKNYTFRANGEIEPDDHPIAKQFWNVKSGVVYINGLQGDDRAIAEIQEVYQETLTNILITSE